ncbi:hypothetical protein K443DRAFT_654939 [Laccaria amethystina LaAM-08-1]|uniref:Uncharacterized protein n=1 Tax=Laccaria amethystina LaAM-08-1 TaxID=1095629 RepID=A0A0C9XNW8_9AGAR|nr:hypothetical protein K443DRAFT_654939 [Laccaria amethystina LaAM-08-1]
MLGGGRYRGELPILIFSIQGALVPTLAKPSASLRPPKHTWRVSLKGRLPSEGTLPNDAQILGAGSMRSPSPTQMQSMKSPWMPLRSLIEDRLNVEVIR